MYSLEEIRDFIKCPQFGDEEYGKWGALRLEQRKVIYDLINFVECDDLEIKRLKQKIDRLNKIIDKIEEFIQLKIIRYENEKDYILEPQDILDIYYYLKSLKEDE